MDIEKLIELYLISKLTTFLSGQNPTQQPEESPKETLVDLTLGMKPKPPEVKPYSSVKDLAILQALEAVSRSHEQLREQTKTQKSKIETERLRLEDQQRSFNAAVSEKNEPKT